MPCHSDAQATKTVMIALKSSAMWVAGGTDGLFERADDGEDEIQVKRFFKPKIIHVDVVGFYDPRQRGIMFVVFKLKIGKLI
jgi:hypothetical protein